MPRKWTILVLSLASCTASPPGASVAPILAGEPGGDPAVVYVTINDSAICSAALIHPQVVVTAKHCVQAPGAPAPRAPSAFRVGLGSARPGTELDVAAVLATDGAYDPTPPYGTDIAALVLARPLDGVEPMEIRRSTPANLVGTVARATGYGRTEEHDSGVKYYRDVEVLAIEAGLVATDPVACPGDSGGPLTTGREVIGVTSFGRFADGMPPDCRYTVFTAFTDVSLHLDLIEAAVARACSPGAHDSCNGFDDDCDGETDEDCLSDGAPCAGDTECSSGLCADTLAGRVCTRACDVAALGSCDEGMRCAAPAGSCQGLCVAQAVGSARALGEPCDDGEQCRSGLCADPGDGSRRCLPACTPATGACFAGEVCVPFASRCGACVAFERVLGPRAVGEPCDDPRDCVSGHCLTDGPWSYCSLECGADADCARGFRCRSGACARGRRSDIGGACVEGGDCVEGADCVVREGLASVCTRACSALDPCPEATECEGSICMPAGALPGEACPDDRCAAGTCTDGLCKLACEHGTGCGPVLQCARDAEGDGRCAAAPAPSGGCGIATRAPFPAATLALLVLAVALALRRSASTRARASARSH